MTSIGASKFFIFSYRPQMIGEQREQHADGPSPSLQGINANRDTACSGSVSENLRPELVRGACLCPSSRGRESLGTTRTAFEWCMQI